MVYDANRMVEGEGDEAERAIGHLLSEPRASVVQRPNVLAGWYKVPAKNYGDESRWGLPSRQGQAPIGFPVDHP
jgi:hypothetical protein